MRLLVSPRKCDNAAGARERGLDWVRVRPPTIVGVGSRGRTRVIREGQRGRMGLVVRNTLADLLVGAAETDIYVRQAIARRSMSSRDR